MKDSQTQRRHFLKIGCVALATIPVMLVSGRAGAATNAGMRSALKYQDKPQGDKDCASCMHFVPGTSANGPGTCKIIPGDTEISPKGYCIGWAKKA